MNPFVYDLDIDSRLLSLLKGKRVAIVGPAAYLTGKGHGKEIDQYDVVIRPNAFSVPLKAQTDYGRRTDIMFHNMGTPWMPGLKEQVKENPDALKSLKMVVCPVIKADHSEVNFMSWPDTHISACATNFDQFNKDNIPFWWVGVANYKKMYREVGCQPYSGIITLLIASKCYPSELLLTGFDFYLGSGLYYEDYLAPVDSYQERSNKGGSHGSGCNSKNLECAKRWENTESFSKVDSHLRNLLT